MSTGFKEFLASIIILSDNRFDRDDLASLGKTLAQADNLPIKSIPSLVPEGSEKEDCHAE